MIGKLPGHTQVQTTARHAHLANDPVKSAADRIAKRISGVVRETLDISGNRLERLSGDRHGQYSIRVSRSWRICFAWRDGDAFDVELNNHYER